MKRWLPWVLAGLAAGWAFSAWRVPAGKTDREIAIAEFGRLPIVFNGRVQPFDSLARNSLLQIRGKQSANYEPWKGAFDKPQQASAMDWLLEVMTDSETAGTRPVFRVDHPDLKGLFKLSLEGDPAQRDDGKHYSWNQLAGEMGKFEETAKSITNNAANQTVFQKAVLKLRSALSLQMRLQATLQAPGSTTALANLTDYEAILPAGTAAFRDRFSNQPFNTNALTAVVTSAQRFYAMEGMEGPLVIPAATGAQGTREWQRMGSALLEASIPLTLYNHLTGRQPIENPDEVTRLVKTVGSVALNPATKQYAAMADSYRAGRYAEVRQQINTYRASLQNGHAADLAKTRSEQAFSNWAPFYKTMVLDVLAFILVGTFWVTLAEPLRRIAWWLVLVGFVVHTSGLIMRMVLEGRPPVTNLYSSAVFIGWGAVGLGLILEKFWRNAIGLAVASGLGFVTLIIAHGLSKDGDTMEMLQAVLDTNFWLATHVVIVTLGYAATYVAGFLAMLYVVLGLATRVLTAEMARSLSRAVYGILCFATLFSFVGTVLGGIWADQSWGRFWGWDPKENGALIIVLWNALILHARWGGMVRERGIMLLALVGNIVTSWSWFGTNMLGIGLHSYGFMDRAFIWLMTFIASQILLVAVGLIPQPQWLSFRGRTT